MTTIKLQKFDDKFEDYYDSEKGLFVLYAGTRGFQGIIEPDIKIEDYNGAIWDCYLVKAEYIPALDMYEIKYKKY